MHRSDDITALLKRFHENESGAQSQLIAAVYDELRVMARRYMAREKQGCTIQATALVHEAYLRLAKMQKCEWQNRSHFFAVAATVMRHILVDQARRYLAGDLEGRHNLISIDERLELPQTPERWLHLLDVHGALEKLDAVDSRAGRVVELRFFGGLTMEETAEALGRSRRSVQRDWKFGRAFLCDELTRK